MTIIEAAKQVLHGDGTPDDPGGVRLLRLRKDTTNEFDVKPDAFTGKKRGWFYLDAFTASAIVAVHDALNEANRQKYVALPLPKLISVTWKLCK